MPVQPGAELGGGAKESRLHARANPTALCETPLARGRRLLQHSRRRIFSGDRGAGTEMKQRKVSTDSDPAHLQRLNEYLERHFPDFFAEARFQVGDDDYFLYARFGQYLARSIEQNRASGRLITRGFAVLNRMARAAARNPPIRQMLVSGPLEYILDAPRARALARKRLCAAAQGYLEGLCE
jgi:hypothetical protein